MTLERVGVVGAGLMGSGIAEVCARAGLDVVVHEVSNAAADAGRARVEKSLGRGVERGKLGSEDRDAALGRLTFVTDLTAMSDRQVVVEAVTEDETLKLDIFRALDRAVTDQRRLAGIEHLVAPHNPPRHRHLTPRPGHRAPFLQPGAGDEVGGVGEHGPHR